LQTIKNNDNNKTSPPPLITRQTTPVAFAFTSIRSPYTKRHYPRKLKLFLTILICQVKTWKNKPKPFWPRPGKEKEE
jgi:hypothetical protein